MLLSVAGGDLPTDGTRWATAKVVAHILATGERKVLAEDASGARYVPTGHLVYLQRGVLSATPLDPSRLEVASAKVGIVEGVARPTVASQFAFSRSGSLIYIPGPVASAVAKRHLALVSLRGGIQRLNVEMGPYAFPRASKDGKRIVFQRTDTNESSVWVLELAEGTSPRRLTLPGSGSNRYPIWSPDGQWVAFQSDRDADTAMWRQRADGAGTAEKITRPEKGVAHIPDSWSPDGQTISFTVIKPKLAEIWTYSLQTRQTAVFATAPGAALGRSVFSPDGRWVAYQAAAQPNSRMYVRPFPPTETAYVAPEDRDAHHPLWSPDGKTLIYCPGPGQYGQVTFNARPSVTFGTPKLSLSGFMTAVPGSVRTFDLMPDGQQFIGVVQDGLLQAAGSGQQFEVVLNWFEDLKQRVAGK
jgi:dipeptidyl aminopeptidase/acylaminoacyl peptidase